jgi:ribosomal protein L21E
MNLVDARDTAQTLRAKHSEKKWSEQTRALAPLKVGDTVMVQNQSGNHLFR